MAKSALGRGLGALLGGSGPASPQVSSPAPVPASAPVSAAAAVTPAPLPTSPEPAGVRQVPLSQIQPSPLQPRKDFPPESLNELAESLKEQGIIQPLVVRAVGDHLELIAGERRWRAAQLAGLTEVPVILREADDRTVLELALVENLQRENLNPVEEAHGYAQLQEAFQLTQEEVSIKVGKSRAAVANALRLLRLAPEVQLDLKEGRLSTGHAKVLLGIEDHASQTRLARRVIADGLNVRQTEGLVNAARNPQPGGLPAAPHNPPAPRDVHVVAIESRLQERLGTRVHLEYRKGRGAIEVRYFSDEDLNRILALLGVSID